MPEVTGILFVVEEFTHEEPKFGPGSVRPAWVSMKCPRSGGYNQILGLGDARIVNEPRILRVRVGDKLFLYLHLAIHTDQLTHYFVPSDHTPQELTLVGAELRKQLDLSSV